MLLSACHQNLVLVITCCVFALHSCHLRFDHSVLESELNTLKRLYNIVRNTSLPSVRLAFCARDELLGLGITDSLTVGNFAEQARL